MANSKLALSSGEKIPSIGFGTWMITDPAELENALDAALEAGYRHFDTAFMYGNETVIGTVLKRWIEEGKVTREELFITTKLPPHGMSPLKVMHFLGISLKMLQLDYVDLYLCHFPYGTTYTDDGTPFSFNKSGKIDMDPSTDLVGIWEEMEYAVSKGLTKSIGVSNFNAEQLQRISKAAKIPPANLQVEMHAYFQQRELREICKKLNVAVSAYAPLGSSGRAAFHAALKAPFEDIGLLEDAIVVEIATKHHKTPAQILIKYLLHQHVVVLTKSIKPERLRENIDVFDFKLSPEDLSRLEKLDKGTRGRSFTWHFLPGLTGHPEYPFQDVLFAEEVTHL